MDTLREEILQAQQVRSDLLKWKLVVVGGVGAVGLGLAGAEGPAEADLVLAAIPPACVYVDLLCRHLSLRILVVGAFMRGANVEEAGVLKAYEGYAQQKRSAFELEEWALALSTLVLSLAVFGYGLYVLLGPEKHAGWAFVGSGVVGLVFTWLAWCRFETRLNELDEREPGKLVRLLRCPPRERPHRETRSQ
jgi:hypothetical protein